MRLSAGSSDDFQQLEQPEGGGQQEGLTSAARAPVSSVSPMVSSTTRT